MENYLSVPRAAEPVHVEPEEVVMLAAGCAMSLFKDQSRQVPLMTDPERPKKTRDQPRSTHPRTWTYFGHF